MALDGLLSVMPLQVTVICEYLHEAVNSKLKVLKIKVKIKINNEACALSSGSFGMSVR